jgi:uncharacterized membrane protein YhhN
MLALCAVIALGDWWAVATSNRSVEYVLKPATMVALIGVALALHPAIPAMRWWFVAALVLSMLGDIFLMLPDEEKWFVPGLGSFLLGHFAYIYGLWKAPMSSWGVIVGAISVFTLLGAVAPTIVSGARDRDRRLAVPVTVYILTISTMVVSAIGSRSIPAILGALLFYLSDFSIGWSRFVSEFRSSRMVIITTYHLAQILLVLSLVDHHG